MDAVLAFFQGLAGPEEQGEPRLNQKLLPSQISQWIHAEKDFQPADGKNGGKP